MRHLNIAVKLPAVVLLFCVTYVIADQEKPRPDPEFQKLRIAADAALGLTGLYEPHINRDDDNFHFSYRTRKYMIHRQLKSGKFTDKTEEMEGPGYQGYILRVHLQDADKEKATPPWWAVNSSYWITEQAVIKLKTGRQLRWSLQRGRHLHANTLTQIRALLDANRRAELFDAFESVFRHQIEKNFTKTVYLSAAWPDDFLARFKDLKINVKALPQKGLSRGGTRYYIKRAKWINKDKLEITGGYLKVSPFLSHSTEHTFAVERKESKWVVTKYLMTVLGHRGGGYRKRTQQNP